MHIRGTCVVALGFVGVLSGVTEQAVAADDLSRRNNLHVTRPNAPRHPDDSFSRMFPGLPPYAPQTDEAQNQSKSGLTGRHEDTKNFMIQNIRFKLFFVA